MAVVADAGTGRLTLEWSKAIEIGHGDIDGQHQQLFDLLRDLRLAAGGGRETSAVQAGLDGLKQYAVNHFAFEDGIMDSFKYDECTVHRAAHSAFMKNIASIEQSLQRRKGAAESYGKVVDFIYDWLISHINNIDRTMVAKLKGVHQDRYTSHEVASQTGTVIEDAFIVAGEVERASTRLGSARKALERHLLGRDLKYASERLINLLNLADTRLELFGCSDGELAKLRGMQGAMRSSAGLLLKNSVKELTDYGARIILGKYDLPLGAGVFMARKATEIKKLLQVIGGLEHVDPALKENVSQALSMVGDVMELENETLGMQDYE